MNLRHVPLLAAQRRLLDLPRGRERFETYLRELRGDGGDIALPLQLFNPMSREHVARGLEAWLNQGAETACAQACAQASARLASCSADYAVGLVMVDDALGGWTNRFTTEWSHSADPGDLLKRGWLTVLLWSSEPADAVALVRATLATAFRAAHYVRHGTPRTLRAMLAQEGLAAVFAGATLSADDRAALETARDLIAAHLDTPSYPHMLTCFYGDVAAESLGYDPLGVPPRAGLAYAVAEVQARGLDPIAALAG
jgi:hypothetical protein